MQPKYTVERHEHGWLVRGRIPFHDIAWLMRLVPEDGLLDGRIAELTGATIALTTTEDSEAWRWHLGIQP